MDETDNWYSPDAATFGDRVAAAREQAGMTQDQLAKRLGVRVTSLRQWEEDLSEPRANRLSMLAGLLNVSMVWLINGTGEGIEARPDEAALPADLIDTLNALRELRADLLKQAEQVGRMEKHMRRSLNSGAR